MSLLAPLFLLGLGLIALPLWLHRLQTRQPTRRPFSSAMLLEAEEQRLRVQKSLKYLLLLALRIALLALLALAFAKPLWRHAALAGAPARLHLIVLDSSLSMNHGERFARAKDEARGLIEALPGNDRAALIAAGDTLELVGPGATADKAALRAALAALKAGAGRLDYATAVAGLDTLAGDTRDAVIAHLITDAQASALPARFGDLIPRSSARHSIELQVQALAPDEAANWSVDSIRRNGGSIDVGVRGWNAPARSLGVTLLVNGMERGRQIVALAADGAATAHFQTALNSGENRVVARLDADALPVDDVRYAVLENGRSEGVPLLTASATDLAPKYVGVALSAAGDRDHVEAATLAGFDARTLPRYRWLAIDDLGAVDEALAARLTAYLEDGGAVFAAVGERAAARRTLPLSGEAVAPEEESPLGIGAVDVSHPLLGGMSGWEGVSVGRMLRVTPAAEDRILVSASNGDPLLLERRVGRGRLLLLTTSLNNDWSDLPVQPVFVSFIAEMAAYLEGRQGLGNEQTVGAILPLGLGGDTAGQVIDPAGRTVFSLAATRHAHNVKLDEPGFYQVYTAQQEALIAVNPDARESDLRRMSEAELARWRAAAAAPKGEGVTRAGVPPASELWRWLLPLLAALVLAESLLGNWTLRRGARLA